MRSALLFYILFFLSHVGTIFSHSLPIKQVVIWGHKLHSHTHSYIHEGFYRAFLDLGYKTLWLDDTDDISLIDFSHTLFITEGQVEKNLPVRTDCFYVIHNYVGNKYRAILDSGHGITLQVYTHGCGAGLTDLCQEAPFIFTSKSGKIIFMPWATDLLPHEIDQIKITVQNSTPSKKNIIYFVGTISGTAHGNEDCMEPFLKACRENKIQFSNVSSYFGAGRPIERDEHITLIQKSLFAPIIVGPWQRDSGYIPCRAFKNVSYGQYPLTNSSAVNDLFMGKAVYNRDTYQLFYDARNLLNQDHHTELFELMDFVKNYHTYLNRVDLILTFFSTIYENYHETT